MSKKTTYAEKTLILDSFGEEVKPADIIPYLVVLAGDQVGRVIRLQIGESYTFGRKRTCDIFLDDSNISREHAVLQVSPEGHAMLIDHGSTNGSRVNGKRVKRKAVQDGDRISLGNVVLKFSIKDDVEFMVQHQMFEKATKDALTGIYNRAYFLDILTREFRAHKRSGNPLSILIFDIDNFKVINDTYGHLSGDMVLKVFANEILGELRQEDLFARFGGEEFIALFTNTSRDSAVQIAEKLRTLTHQIEFETHETVFTTSVTIGVACYEKGNFEHFEALIHCADECLYLGKASGKNCVIHDIQLQGSGQQ